MARSKKYKIKGVTSSIAFSSRASVKINDKYYTVEAHEERFIPELEDIDMDKERRDLWDTVNGECDKQIADILNLYK